MSEKFCLQWDDFQENTIAKFSPGVSFWQSRAVAGAWAGGGWRLYKVVQGGCTRWYKEGRRSLPVIIPDERYNYRRLPHMCKRPHTLPFIFVLLVTVTHTHTKLTHNVMSSIQILGKRAWFERRRTYLISEMVQRWWWQGWAINRNHRRFGRLSSQL